MEVHHHSHVANLPAGQAGKRFKEYFLEFLMIFLAVTLGFIAENLREGMNNRETERKNMETIIANLKSDTTQLNGILELNYLRVKSMDSINTFRYRNLTDTMVLKELIPFFDQALTFDYFRSSKAAIDQMRSTDGFRLVKKRGVVDSIFAYEDWNGLLDLNVGYLDFFQRRVFLLYEKLFDPRNLMETSRNIDKNRNMLLEFFNTVNDVNVSLKTFYTPHLEVQLKKASRLIDLIDRSYNFKTNN